MVNTNKLKGEIIARGFSQKKVYELIGLTRRQWELRMRSQKFDSEDIMNICNVLGRDILPIFFEEEST